MRSGKKEVTHLEAGYFSISALLKEKDIFHFLNDMPTVMY